MAKGQFFAGWRVAVVVGGSIGKSRQRDLEQIIHQHGGFTISNTELNSVMTASCGDECSGGKVVAVADGMTDDAVMRAMQLPSVICQSCGKERISFATVVGFISASIRANSAVTPPPRNAHPPAQPLSDGTGPTASSPAADQAGNAGRKREREESRGSDADTTRYDSSRCNPPPTLFPQGEMPRGVGQTQDL